MNLPGGAAAPISATLALYRRRARQYGTIAKDAIPSQRAPRSARSNIVKWPKPNACDSDETNRRINEKRGAPRLGAPHRLAPGVEFGYLPVFMNWMQSPWFLKDEPSERSSSLQPPFLQSFLLFFSLTFSPRWTLLTVQRPASSAMTNGVAPTCHVGCAATNAAQVG